MPLWRIALGAAYVAWALICSFVLGGGLFFLLLFAVWGVVWLGFSVFGSWADRARQALLRPPDEDRGA